MNSSISNSTGVRNQLRSKTRQKRHLLSKNQQVSASNTLTKLVLSSGLVNRFNRFVFYIPTDNEISPIRLMNILLKRGKLCFLPSLYPLRQKKQLWFIPIQDQMKWHFNQFNILEPLPKYSSCHKPWTLDVVFTPLVCFDGKKNRLGMGAGYYDRTFSYLNLNGPKKPLLIGLAYDFQQVKLLPVTTWDIPLAGIITDKSILL